MADYDVSKATYGDNSYILNDAKSRAAIITGINTGRKNLLNIAGLEPKEQTINGVTFSIGENGEISFARTQTSSSNSKLFLFPGCSDGAYGIELDYTRPLVITGVGAGGGASGSYEIQVNMKPNDSSSYTTYYQRNNVPLELPAGRIRRIALVVKSSWGKSSSVTPMLCYKDYYDLTSTTIPFYETPADRAIAKILDSGPKNLVNYTRASLTLNRTTWTNNGDGTCTVSTSTTASAYYSYRIVGDPDNTGWAYGQPIKKGKYILTGCPEGADSSTYRYILGLAPDQNSRSSTSYYAPHVVFEVTNDTTRFDLAIYVAGYADISTPVTFKPMICTVDDFLVSPAFQPYRPSYQELYDMVKALQT